MSNHGWTCPFCNRIATITNSDMHTDFVDLMIDNAHGNKRVIITFIVCPNPECKEFILIAKLYNSEFAGGSSAYTRYETRELTNEWELIPSSQSKVFPEYVPQAIVKDYEEACLIKELSPKASATLSRRCLQGIIRDFWGIKKNRLVDEIEAIKDKVDTLTWDAIDAVRKIGNIGAHMEKDINVIIDVDPKEASLLIELIELLIKDWYITKHERQQRLQNIIDVKDSKEQMKK
ncbi:DUF4145 domain-containing protein [Paenibacillus kribbensis]|uniref:DUF4145 domain-containing protein n=1 Tax=Paenibacillus kribbensis TaxID=172713 RepID=UPI002DBEA3A0|nr:DUF4145 domain-containing protein [Paenibacillus kribbensis]MEC0233723.1 DUF4145 domain-containing protein [Paenibacillus kribbensis]